MFEKHLPYFVAFNARLPFIIQTVYQNHWPNNTFEIRLRLYLSDKTNVRENTSTIWSAHDWPMSLRPTVTTKLIFIMISVAQNRSEYNINSNSLF